ncbi:MAG: hypothetical protein WB918_05945, partial [Candidatus Sulfotelmatobacter sp.]
REQTRTARSIEQILQSAGPHQDREPCRKVITKRTETAAGPFTANFFHSDVVTSNLAPKIKSRDHGRGRDGWVNPTHRAPKSFVL